MMTDRGKTMGKGGAKYRLHAGCRGATSGLSHAHVAHCPTFPLLPPSLLPANPILITKLPAELSRKYFFATD